MRVGHISLEKFISMQGLVSIFVEVLVSSQLDAKMRDPIVDGDSFLESFELLNSLGRAKRSFSNPSVFIGYWSGGLGGIGGGS